jgi:hypothetical protein
MGEPTSALPGKLRGHPAMYSFRSEMRRAAAGGAGRFNKRRDCINVAGVSQN